MANKINPGNFDEVKMASNDGIQLTLLRKDFSKQNFVRVNLNKATISKCLFNETKFFANQYNECDFISCDFTKADFLNVKFISCKFHECKFDEAMLQEVNFENCTILTCTFVDTKLNDNVIGLDERDLNVIHEEADENSDLFMSMGFEAGDGQYIICDQVDDGPTVCLSIVKDPELGDSIYRVSFNINDETILSDTFDVNSDDKEMISRIVKGVLISGKSKASADEEQFFDGNGIDFNNFNASSQKVKNQFKQIFND